MEELVNGCGLMKQVKLNDTVLPFPFAPLFIYFLRSAQYPKVDYVKYDGT